MRKNKLRLIGLLVIPWIFIFSINSVFADVPSVLTITIVPDASTSTITVEIRHADPSSSHYIDIIEVEVNERLDRISDLNPQTATVFSYQHSVGDTVFDSLRVRVHCNVHGWGGWKAEGTTDATTPFYMTPIGIVAIVGIVVVVIVAIVGLRRR